MLFAVIYVQYQFFQMPLTEIVNVMFLKAFA